MPWITDAQMAGPLEEVDTHQTQDIRKFLSRGNEHNFILVASKGMGKTTLMRLKREQLQRDNSRLGITLIPFNFETDIVTLPSPPDKTIWASLQTEDYWRSLWETAIMTSVILTCNPSAEVVGRQRASGQVQNFELPSEIVDDLQSCLSRNEVIRRKPSEVLDRLLQYPKGSFERFRRRDLSKLTFIFRDVITSGCAVFVDSLDQELELRFPGDLEIWRTGQLGLMRAAWELNRQNGHVKIFVSIRQEAWASFVSPVKNNILGSTIVIKYTDSDLRKIFELAIRKNDGPYSIEDFCGFSTLDNHYIGQKEDIFEFIKRHTLGSPRWLILLGSEIARIRDARGPADSCHLATHQRAVADTVNTEAARLAKDYLEAEMSLFFKRSNPADEVKLLLRPVQSTVLTLANVTRLNERYQSASPHPVSHPFCLLVNLGLVGYSTFNLVRSEPMIRFRMPYEFDWHYSEILPKQKDTVYFLHPSLHQLAADNSSGFKYFDVRIGDHLRLSQVELERISARRFSIFVSYSSGDWEKYIAPLLEELEDSFNETGEFVDIWIDRTHMQGARKYLAQMSEGNRTCDFMLFFASMSSIQSEAVRHEISQRKDMDFKSGKETLFTIVLDDLLPADLPFGLGGDHVLYRHDPSFQIEKLAGQLSSRHRMAIK